MYEYNIPPICEEPRDTGNPYREAYLQGLDALVARRRAEVTKARHAFGETIRHDREAARAEFLKMLGWPLTGAPSPVLSVKEIPVFEKYDEFVPDELIRKGFACGVLDIDGMLDRIRTWGGGRPL